MRRSSNKLCEVFRTCVSAGILHFVQDDVWKQTAAKYVLRSRRFVIVILNKVKDPSIDGDLEVIRGNSLKLHTVSKRESPPPEFGCRLTLPPARGRGDFE